MRANRTARLEGGRKKQPAGAMEGPAGVRSVAGTGREQPAYRAGNTGVDPDCDARYDALSPDRVELLARAVILVAGMAIPEAAREAVLALVMAELANAAEEPPVTLQVLFGPRQTPREKCGFKAGLR